MPRSFPDPAARVAQPPERPLMIFDGDCEFCRYWIRRWQRSSGAEADFLEFQKLGGRFPEIPQSAFETAVQLIEPDGRISSGADAVLRLSELGKGGSAIRRLRAVPGFLPLARIGYRFIAERRAFFSRITRALLGGSYAGRT